MSANTPAFPCEGIVERDEKGHLYGPEISSAGMTLRDYFAAKAMQAMLNAYYQDPDAVGWPDEAIAIGAYKHADAMLAEREASSTK